MELINDIQVEVTELRIKVNSLMNSRKVFEFKRLIFIADILQVAEENYLAVSNYISCSAIYVDNEGWVKVKEPYVDIVSIHSEWWRLKVKDV